MDLRSRIKEIIEAEPNDSQLDKFLAEVRDSLASSNKQFLAYSTLLVTALLTYHIIIYEGAPGVSFLSIPISNTSLFRRVFLVFPAALIAAAASIGYLRRIQRETYDWLAISRHRVLGKTGLHELRLPPDYILGLFVLRNEGGKLGKFIGNSVAIIFSAIFVLGPALYVISQAVINLTALGISDTLCLITSLTAIILSMCGLLIVALAGRIKP